MLFSRHVTMEIGIEQESEVNLDWETNNRDTEVKRKKQTRFLDCNLG